jgi:putative membrane protein
MRPKTIIILILLLFCLVILIQNTQVVTLRVLFWHITMSRILLIPLLLVIGFVVGYLMAAVKGRQKEKSAG